MGMYEQIGIDISKLGCVMLNTAPLSVHDSIPEQFWHYGELPGSRVGGPEKEAHVTLLFGLLQNAHVWRAHVDEVLDGWTPPDVIEIVEYGVFTAATYDVVIGHVNNQTEVRDAHHRLSRLPHINTFPYKPHVTIGYVRKGLGKYLIPDLILMSRGHASNIVQLPTRGLNYGDRLEEAAAR